MSASDRDGENAGRRRALSRIADVLGEPVEAFTAPNPDTALGELQDLLRLWFALETAEQRQRALAILRTIAEH